MEKLIKFSLCILLIGFISANFGYGVTNEFGYNQPKDITIYQNITVNGTGGGNITINTTQFDEEPLTLKESWLESFVNGSSKFEEYLRLNQTTPQTIFGTQPSFKIKETGTSNRELQIGFTDDPYNIYFKFPYGNFHFDSNIKFYNNDKGLMFGASEQFSIISDANYLYMINEPPYNKSNGKGIKLDNDGNAYFTEEVNFNQDDGVINMQDSLGIYTDDELAFDFRAETIDAAEMFFGMPPQDPMLLPTDIKRLAIQDYKGDIGIDFSTLGIIPLSDIGFPFDFAGATSFTLNEPNNTLLEGNGLGASFSAVDKNGATIIGFVIQTDFGGHRFEMGSVADNPTILPTFEFAATGGYDEPEEADPIENPRFVLQAQPQNEVEPNIWWLRFYPKPVDSGLEEAFDPFGVMFGDGTSNHSLHSGDVVITAVSSYGGSLGGNLEVEKNIYCDGNIVMGSTTLTEQNLIDLKALL